MYITGVSEVKKKEGGAGTTIWRNSNPKFSKSDEKSKHKNPKSPTNSEMWNTRNVLTKEIKLRHIRIKFFRIREEEKILKSKSEGTKMINRTADFLSNKMQAQRQWSNVFEALKKKYCQHRIIYPEKVYVQNEGKIKSCLNRHYQKNPSTADPH